MHVRRVSTSVLATLIALGCTKHEYIPPKVQANPSQRDIYNVTLTLDDRFGSPVEINAISHYAVENTGLCTPNDKWAAIGGLHPGLYKEIPSSVRPLDQNTYAFRLVLDPFVDEDYFGLGVCNWKPMVVSMDISYEAWSINASFAPQRHVAPDHFLLFCNSSNMCGEGAPPETSRAIQVRFEKAAS